MNEPIARQAGSAFVWKAVQHAGIKCIFLIRLVVLARLLSPDDFGLLAISMVAVGIMSRVTDVGMIPALVQRPTADRVCYDAAWTVGMIRAAVIMGVVFLIAPVVADLFDDPRATPIIRALALLPLLEASASIKIAELIRNLEFRALTLIKLPEALANTVISIALASSLGVWALVAGTLAGPTAVLFLSYVLAPYRPRFSLNRSATRSLIQFGRWIFLTGLIAVVGSSVLRLIITRQLGTAELGLYYLSASLAFLPTEVATQVIGDVTFPLFSRLQTNMQKVTRIFQSICTGLFAVLIPACLLLVALAPALTEHVLGPKWAGTVPVVRVLALVSLIGLLGEIIVPILMGIGTPAKVVVLEGLQASLLLAFAGLFIAHWGLSGAAMAWLPAVAAAQIVGIWFVKRMLPHPFAGLAKPFAIIAVTSILGALFASVIYALIPSLLGLIAGGCLTVAGIALMLWMSDRWLALGLTADLALAFPRVAALVGHPHPDR